MQKTAENQEKMTSFSPVAAKYPSTKQQKYVSITNQFQQGSAYA
jgi:hypothetical protein